MSCSSCSSDNTSIHSKRRRVDTRSIQSGVDVTTAQPMGVQYPFDWGHMRGFLLPPLQSKIEQHPFLLFSLTLPLPPLFPSPFSFHFSFISFMIILIFTKQTLVDKKKLNKNNNIELDSENKLSC